MARAVLLVLAALLAASSAEGQATVPVAAREIPRGAVVTSEDVAFAPAGDHREDGVVARPVGWVTRRLVAAGEVLRAPALGRPDLVRSGSAVQLVWREDGVELRIRGKAMSSAAEGERVAVHVDGRRRFEGTVIGPSLVRLEAPNQKRR